MYMCYVLFYILGGFVFGFIFSFLFYFVKPNYNEVKQGWNIQKTALFHKKICKVEKNFHVE